MRCIREVLRLKFTLALSHREIAAGTGLSKGSVGEYLRRARAHGVTWESASRLSDRELEDKLFEATRKDVVSDRVPVDLNWVHRQMRHKGVTLQLLWVEYCEASRNDAEHRRPYQYSRFCILFRKFKKQVDVSMRQVHRAGEKCFIDYSGAKPSLVDRNTGEVKDVELYVAVLGASSYTFAEATLTQQRDDFIGSTARAFEYFGGVPQIAVPDQLRSAVSGPDRIDPKINPVFAEFGRHYGVAIIPARPRKPKDKAKVEGAVLITQRWILARLRNITFFCLEDLNAAIAELLEDLNARAFQKLDGCRRSHFEQLDRPALSPLPRRRFEPSTWKSAKVHIDHHVEFEARYYSAPYPLVGAKVWVRATVTSIELIADGVRVASHRRSYSPKGTYVTVDAHRPKSHREYGAWPPQRIINWASELGPSAGLLVETIMRNKPHPEQGYRSCMALIRDAKRYPKERLEAACLRALQINAPTRTSVIAILKNGLDRQPLDEEPENSTQLEFPITHENVRGGAYYATRAENAGEDDENGDEDDRRTDVSKIERDEADRDGRGLPRAQRRGAEQPAELRREDGLHGRQGVDGKREPAAHSPAARREAD